MSAAVADTRHIVCITCGGRGTHVVAYIRPKGLAAKVYAFCELCPDDTYTLAPLHL